MMSITARTEGLQGFAEDLVRESVEDNIIAVDLATAKLMDQVRRNLDPGGRGGASYRSSKTGAVHTSSAEGEFPAKLSGALRDSVGRTKADARGNVVTASVGVGRGPEATRTVASQKREGINVFEYALALEIGGFVQGRRIGPRSYLRRSEIEVQPAVSADWGRMLR